MIAPHNSNRSQKLIRLNVLSPTPNRILKTGSNKKLQLLMRTTQDYFIRLFLTVFLLLGSLQVSGQIISDLAITPADNPNLGGNSPWPAVCAGNNGGFNQFYATVSYSGGPNPDNEWILELSDASGDFTAPIELARSSDDAIVQNPGFEFAIPTDTRGQGYLMRVRSTSPAETSPSDGPYHFYYMDVVSNLNISEDGSGTPPGSICSSTPITLQVDNIPNSETYPYIWYRDLTEIVGEKSRTLNITTSGTYQAFLDYGDCTGSGTTASNTIIVTIGVSGSGTTINPPSKTALCSGDIETLTVNTSVGSPIYQWYKNGTAISGATGATFNVDGSSASFEGDYTVEVSSIGVCPELSPAITFTNADNFTITRVNAANIVLLPSDTEILSITTTASSPTYQWFRNGSPISGATAISYNAIQEGTYYVAVTQPAGICPSPTTKNSEITELVTPASFEIIIDYATSYTACVATSIVLEVDIINAVMADNSKIDVTSDVSSSFTYQWKKDGADVASATSANLSLTNTSENGNYTVDGTLSTYNTSSNQLSVQLLTNETLTISSSSTIYCSSSDTITISTTTDLTAQNFDWQRDGVSVNTTNAALNVNAPGTYRLVINKNGCDLISNEIAINPLDPNLITIDSNGVVVFPEGTNRTITASGGTAYRWFDSNNVEISNTASVTLTVEGDYVLVANIDNCEITRQITVEYLDTFNVPNVITPNGDGANDQWILPNSYSNKSDINVIIYDERGVEVMNIMGYQNNWPQSTTAFIKQNMVFYYIVKNASETLKQGTITVIR